MVTFGQCELGKHEYFITNCVLVSATHLCIRVLISMFLAVVYSWVVV